MKSLRNPVDKQEILERLQQVNSASSRRWGRMTPHQMICHLNDSFRAAMGEAAVSSADNRLPPILMKWIALRVPVRWPKGVQTRPEMDQQAGGTRPVEFSGDVRELRERIERFTEGSKDNPWPPHPIFGKMSEWEWLRWGYLHVDHHLRQFGA